MGDDEEKSPKPEKQKAAAEEEDKEKEKELEKEKEAEKENESEKEKELEKQKFEEDKEKEELKEKEKEKEEKLKEAREKKLKAQQSDLSELYSDSKTFGKLDDDEMLSMNKHFSHMHALGIEDDDEATSHILKHQSRSGHTTAGYDPYAQIGLVDPSNNDKSHHSLKSSTRET